MLSDLLHDSGYAVLEASDSDEALAYLRDSRPDLIVLDLTLPGMSGWQFLERARPELDCAHIPVVALSAIRGEGNYPDMLGVAACLSKPVHTDDFLGAVEQLVGRPPRQAHEGRARSGMRLLVVEDEKPIRDLLLEFLTDTGYCVVLAESIADARAVISREPPALVILDLMLPGRSGWDFLRDRQADPVLAAMPVVVISAAPEDRLVEAKQLGADAFLSKPFDLDTLTALVESYASAH